MVGVKLMKMETIYSKGEIIMSEHAVIIEKPFTLYMDNVGDGEVVNCILHSVELYSYKEDMDCRDESIGHMTITIEGSEEFQETEFSIWGNGESDDEYKLDFGGCYICLPTMLEHDDDDELEILHFEEMIDGMVTLEELL
jgi:hypothetical protein